MILTQRGKVCHKEIDNVIKNLQSELNEMKHKYLAVLNKIKHEINRILSKIKKQQQHRFNKCISEVSNASSLSSNPEMLNSKYFLLNSCVLTKTYTSENQ